MFKGLLKFLFWSLVFLGLLAVVDQTFVRVALDQPGYREARRFYLDFRARLLGEVARRDPDSIGAAIEQADTRPPAAAAKSPRWVYADESGALQFADSLEEVPAKFRAEAQPLEQQ